MIKEIGLENLIAHEQPAKLDTKVKNMIKNRITECYRNIWLNTNSDGHTKIETYQSFKTEFKMEPYLKLRNQKYRTQIAKFRTSSHTLAIETGRHTKPITPQQRRTCKQCTSGAVETEKHAVLSCDAYNNVREPFLETVKNVKPDLLQQSITEQYKYILSCSDIKALTLKSRVGVMLVISCGFTNFSPTLSR